MTDPDLSTPEGLGQELEAQAALLIAVACGGPRIDAVQAEYQQRRQRLVRALGRRGLDYPFPWPDLWKWYGSWGKTWAERRMVVRDLVTPVLDAVGQLDAGAGVVDPNMGAVAAWADLDGRIAGLSAELIGASSLDDLQDVGRRAREVVIDCARLVADPALVPAGREPPKAADAKAWLDLFLAGHAGGRNRDELRRLVRAAWDLAQTVTHSDIQRIDAFAAAQATVLVVRVCQELSRPAGDAG